MKAKQILKSAPNVPGKKVELDEMKEMFKLTMRNIYTVFGSEGSGWLYSTINESSPDKNGHWDSKFSVSAFDIQASALGGHHPAKV